MVFTELVPSHALWPWYAASHVAALGSVTVMFTTTALASAGAKGTATSTASRVPTAVVRGRPVA